MRYIKPNRWRKHKDFRCEHHIRNRKDGGTNEKHNLLYVWRSKERLFHALFDNMTLLEASELLYRVHRAKETQRMRRVA